jgi:hypothetical protein
MHRDEITSYRAQRKLPPITASILAGTYHRAAAKDSGANLVLRARGTEQRSCVNAGTLERAVRRVSGGQPSLLSPLRRFAVCRMADGSVVAFDQFDLLELSGAPRGPKVPNTRKRPA